MAGKYRVCATVLGKTTASNKSLGCRTITVPGKVFGAGSITKAGHAAVVVSGWTFDNRAASRSTKVIVTVDHRKAYTVKANQNSPAVRASFKITGNHRYSAPIWVGVGKHTVCVTAVGAKASAQRSLGCKTVSFSSPKGSVSNGHRLRRQDSHRGLGL